MTKLCRRYNRFINSRLPNGEILFSDRTVAQTDLPDEGQILLDTSCFRVGRRARESSSCRSYPSNVENAWKIETISTEVEACWATQKTATCPQNIPERKKTLDKNPTKKHGVHKIRSQ